MTLRELENICKRHFYLHQLFCLKRCHGPNASLNVVMEPGKTKRCRTIKDLVDAEMYVPSHMQMYEAEFASIPPICSTLMVDSGVRIQGVLDDDAEIAVRTMDGQPESPWDVSRREQEAARTRLMVKRKMRHLENSLCLASSPFDYAI